MAPVLYTMPASGDSAAVLMTAKAIGISLQQKELKDAESIAVELENINPQQVLPTLNDNGFIVWHSHVINQYLVEKYGKGDSLYPKNFQRRMMVDQMLNFNCSVLQLLLLLVNITVLNRKLREIPRNLAKRFKGCYCIFERFLKQHKWAAGDSVTIADFCLYTSILALDALVKVDPKVHSYIFNWIEKVQALPFFRDRWLTEFQEQFHPDISKAQKVKPSQNFSCFEALKHIFISDSNFAESRTTPILYTLPGNPDLASILMTSQHMGIKLELKYIRSEQLNSRIAKVNPHRALPTLDEGSFIVWHSHVIVLYLVGKYGNDDSLYPKDLQKRTVVNQRLNFSCCVLQTWLIIIDRTFSIEKLSELPTSVVESIQCSYDVLEKLMGGQQWIAGDSLTIADFILYPSILALSLFTKINPKDCPTMCAWVERMKTLPVSDDKWIPEFKNIIGVD